MEVEESERFELSEGCPSTIFKTVAFNRSANSPCAWIYPPSLSFALYTKDRVGPSGWFAWRIRRRGVLMLKIYPRCTATIRTVWLVEEDRCDLPMVVSFTTAHSPWVRLLLRHSSIGPLLRKGSMQLRVYRPLQVARTFWQASIYPIVLNLLGCLARSSSLSVCVSGLLPLWSR